MEWLEKQLKVIKHTLAEVNDSSLSDETKKVVLGALREELRRLETMKAEIIASNDFVKNGFGGK